MDLLRLVLSRQPIEKLLPFRILNDPNFIYIRLSCNGLEWRDFVGRQKGGLRESYVRFCGLNGEICSLSTRYQEGYLVLRRAFFLREPAIVNRLVMEGSNMNIWYGIATDVPEIQARVLGNGKYETLGSYGDLAQIQWTPNLKRLILIIVNRSMDPLLKDYREFETLKAKGRLPKEATHRVLDYSFLAGYLGQIIRGNNDLGLYCFAGQIYGKLNGSIASQQVIQFDYLYREITGKSLSVKTAAENSILSKLLARVGYIYCIKYNTWLLAEYAYSPSDNDIVSTSFPPTITKDLVMRAERICTAGGVVNDYYLLLTDRQPRNQESLSSSTATKVGHYLAQPVPNFTVDLISRQGTIIYHPEVQIPSARRMDHSTRLLVIGPLAARGHLFRSGIADVDIEPDRKPDPRLPKYSRNSVFGLSLPEESSPEMQALNKTFMRIDDALGRQETALGLGSHSLYGGYTRENDFQSMFRYLTGPDSDAVPEFGDTRVRR